MPRHAPFIRPNEDRPLLGIGLVLASIACFSILDTTAKYLVVHGMPALQVTFMRFVMAFILIIAVYAPRHGAQLLHTRSLKLEIVRGLLVLLTSTLNFFALRYLPLTVTASISFTAPLLVTALSVPLLGERVGWRRWLAILVGFIGVIIIINPGGSTFHWAMLISMIATVGFAFFIILNRKLAGVDSVHAQQFYSIAVAMTCLAPLALPYWVWPENIWIWLGFAAMGIFGFAGHVVMTTAYRFADASILAPFTYPQIIFMSVLSWLVFTQPPNHLIFIGAPLVVGSGLYIWLRERNLALKTTALTKE